MATVDHSLPENPTAAEIKQAIKEYVDAKWTEIDKRLTAKEAEIDQAIADATAGSVKVGDQIALQMSAGQVLCADEGGPTEPDEVVEFQSRNPDAIGPHELFTVRKA